MKVAYAIPNQVNKQLSLSLLILGHPEEPCLTWLLLVHLILINIFWVMRAGDAFPSPCRKPLDKSRTFRSTDLMRVKSALSYTILRAAYSEDT